MLIDECHMSSVDSSANARIRSRYSRTTSDTISCRSAGSETRRRATRSMLAASRLTSHSQAPGSVSSKSLMSNTTRRSGVANSPKLPMWASPQAWTRKPDTGVSARSAAMTAAVTAVEGERRSRHPTEAIGDQLRDARLVRCLQDRDRVSSRGWREGGVRRPGHGRAQRPAAFDPIGACFAHRKIGAPLVGSQPPAWPTLVASGRPSASAMKRAAVRTPSSATPDSQPEASRK